MVVFDIPPLHFMLAAFINNKLLLCIYSIINHNYGLKGKCNLSGVQTEVELTLFFDDFRIFRISDFRFGDATDHTHNNNNSQP